jgi:hypothetical protein
MRASFTDEQIDVIFKAYRAVCEQRDIDPLSLQGRIIAARMLDLFDGTETDDEMKRKFTH